MQPDLEGMTLVFSLHKNYLSHIYMTLSRDRGLEIPAFKIISK